jgi:hypothetical protein
MIVNGGYLVVCVFRHRCYCVVIVGVVGVMLLPKVLGLAENVLLELLGRDIIPGAGCANTVLQGRV